MVNPRVEGEVEASETSIALTELRVGKHLGARHGIVHALVRVPRGGRPDCMKAPTARRKMGFEDRLDARAEQEIDVPDHRGAGPRGSEAAAGAHRGHAGDEL